MEGLAADLPAKPPKDFYYTNRYCNKNRCGRVGKLKTVTSQREDDEGDGEGGMNSLLSSCISSLAEADN